VPSILTRVSWLRPARFANWLGICLLLLQALAVSCHEPGAAAGTGDTPGEAAGAYICSAGAPVQPAPPQKAPAKHAFACTYHACGCSPAILADGAGLPHRLELLAAKASVRGANVFTPKAILSNPSVRGPPAHLA
jgi:hypothetical protein